MAYVLTVRDHSPRIHDKVFLAPTATICGDVEMKEGSSAFYGVTVRGDSDLITVGAGTNLQDNVVLHADEGIPCTLGDGVSVGHGAVVHGAEIGGNSLIGMSSTVLNGAKIGQECLIAAGALVPEGMEVPPRSLVAGVPGKIRRELSEEEVAALHRNAEVYLDLAKAHREAKPAS